MSDIPATIAILALGVFLIAVPAVLYFIFREMRAVRKVLQARAEDEYQKTLALQESRRVSDKIGTNIQTIINRNIPVLGKS